MGGAGDFLIRRFLLVSMDYWKSRKSDAQFTMQYNFDTLDIFTRFYNWIKKDFIFISIIRSNGRQNTFNLFNPAHKMAERIRTISEGDNEIDAKYDILNSSIYSEYSLMNTSQISTTSTDSQARGLHKSHSVSKGKVSFVPLILLLNFKLSSSC